MDEFLLDNSFERNAMIGLVIALVIIVFLAHASFTSQYEEKQRLKQYNCYDLKDAIADDSLYYDNQIFAEHRWEWKCNK